MSEACSSSSIKERTSSFCSSGSSESTSVASSDSKFSITSIAISLEERVERICSLVSSSTSIRTCADLSSSINWNKYVACSIDNSSIISAISAICKSQINDCIFLFELLDI